jgi:hypothetical protein
MGKRMKTQIRYIRFLAFLRGLDPFEAVQRYARRFSYLYYQKHHKTHPV